jgi:hypothetical protein
VQNVNKREDARVRMAEAWAWLVAWVAMWRGRIGKAWDVLRGRDITPQGVYIRKSVVQDIDADVLVAPAVLAEEVGIIRAIILQKVYEWCEYNRQSRSRRHHTAGRWWMYLSYEAWRDNHLRWLSVATVRRHIKALVADGYLLSIDAGEITAETWYAVNEAAVRGLLVGGHDASATMQSESAPSQNETSPMQNEGGGGQNEHPTNSKQAVKQSFNSIGKQTNDAGASGEGAGASTVGASGGVVVNQKITGGRDIVFKSPFARTSATYDKDPKAKTPHDTAGDMPAVDGLTPATVEKLVAEFGAERVREVCAAASASGAGNPAGWVVSACREGWDVGAMGATDDGRTALEKYADPDSPFWREKMQRLAERHQNRPDYTGGKYADFIES